MKLLLDTHVWLWLALDPARLSGTARSALDSSEHRLHLSVVSTWEVMVLARKGRIELSMPAEQWVRRALAGAPLTVLPLDLDVAIRSETLAQLDHHRDPADRWLIATAAVHELTLVTADGRIRAYPHVSTLW